MKTFWQQLKPNFFQTQPHKNESMTPDSHQTYTWPDPTIDSTIVSFALFATRVSTVRTSFQFFPHHTNGAVVQSSVTDIGY
jgi:hypothetical protein